LVKNAEKNILTYLEGVPETHRTALEQLYRQIQRLCPQATEHISYGKPLFKLNNHPLVGFYSAKRHLALFAWSDTALGKMGNLLDGYDTAESTIRFHADKPLPEEIVKKLIELRAKEIKERWG
jgi:uncharacterized protein YdhG (YjbR/CyaY superfamily)